MIRKLTVTMIPLSEQSLADFETARALPGERSIKSAHLKQLKKLIKGGRFHGLEWHRGRCQDDGQMYRFDGQHTSQLLRSLLDTPDAEVPFPAGIPITLTEWEFES